MNNELLSTLIKAVEDKKGQNLCVLHLAEVCSFTSYFLLCTGNTSRQTKAICDAVEDAAKQLQSKATHIEGYAGGEWILLDYGEVVVHIFTPKMREFYDLERLWRDAPRIPPEDWRPAPRPRKRKME